MSAESLVGLISGSSGALGAVLIFLTLIMSGVFLTKASVEKEREQYEERLKNKDEQIAEKNEAIRLERDRADNERRRADVAVESVQTANVLNAALLGGHREIGAS
jgi:hypothetical protein